MKQLTFAGFFGNRGFFPESLIAVARKEIKQAVETAGHRLLLMDESETRYGAVESAEEGLKFAKFLKNNEDQYDGVILSLANFGDENGAIAALRDCGVPIYIQAYPDEIGSMDFQHRRDAFCGKLSIMDIFYQYQLPFTVFKPHVIHPLSAKFADQLDCFAAICRVVKKMKRITVGGIGARTTAFKTVRFDELTLQKYGINTETYDLSELFARVRDIKSGSDAFYHKKNHFQNYTNFSHVPGEKLDMIVKTALAIDDMIHEYKLDAIALRCWVEIEKELGISPCVILSDLNNRKLAAACELDICNAIAMHALSAASTGSSACLDWNNNYGEDEDKCILFHCGPVPQSMMEAKGLVTDHAMLVKSLGADCSWGCNEGRIAASPMTFTSAKTEDGKLVFYLGEGTMTDDPIEQGFFGCGGVAEIEGLQSKLLTIGRNGFRHHVSLTFGLYEQALQDAFQTYLGYDMIDLKR